MAENTETTPEAENKDENSQSSKKVFVAIVTTLVLLIFFICGYIVHILNKPAKEETVQEKPTIGIIRIKDAVKAHKDYANIEKLRKEYESVVTEILALSEPVEIKLPEADDELFKDSARQKLSQKIIDKIAVLEEKRRVAVEKYAKDTEPEFEKRRAEIDERYLTTIADLRMKLDNSDILHLSGEKINELSEQLQALQHERGEAQEALKAQRQQEIYNYGEKVIESMSGEISELDKEAEKMMSEAALKESEVMERNMRLLESAFGEDRILKIKEKEDVLEKLKIDLLVAEDKIVADISSIAAKYAVQQGLELVFTDTSISLKSLLPEEFQNGKANVDSKSKVTVINGLDITDDIVKDLLIDEGNL